jgi:2,3-dihydroxybenzoate decarboxylase
MVLSGMFDAHPRLNHPQASRETLPFLPRIDQSLSRPGQKPLSPNVFAAISVTTSGNFSNPALMCCVQEMGVDRILFAVDWPFVVNPPGVKWMETVPLCDEDKAKILSGNAKRLLRM